MIMEQQKRQHQKEIVEIEVHVADVEVIAIAHAVLMVLLPRKKVEKIELQLQQ